jgi:WD40 repeat protein
VWRTGSWELEHDLTGPTNVTSVQFSPSGDRLVTGSIDGTARLYRLTGPQLPPFGDNIWSLAAPDAGELIYVGVGSSDPQVARVDVSDPLAPVVRRPLLGPESAGALDGVVGVSPDGSTVAAGTATGEVVVWRVDESGRPVLVEVLDTAEELIENISFARDGESFAASSDDGTTTVYSLGKGDRPVELAELRIDSLAMGVAVSNDSTLVAVGGADNLVHLWQLDGPAPEKVATLEGFENYVPSAAFSPDGRTLAAGSADGSVRLWDVTSPAAPTPLGKPLVGATDTVFGIAFDESGERLAAASADGILWLWKLDRDGGTLSARLASGGDGLYQALFRPSGRVFAGGASGQVSSWLTEVEAAEALVCEVAGSPISEEEWAQHVPGADYDPPCV